MLSHMLSHTILGWIWDGSPVLLGFFGREVRWYGLLFALAFFLGRLLMIRMYRRENKPLIQVDILFLYYFVSVLIGARLGHVLFYDPVYYFEHPLEVFYVWEGGLASHGAAIGALIGTWLFAKKHRVRYMWLLDRCVLAVILGGFFIRAGNFMNSEVYGKETASSVGVFFSYAPKQVFKSQLRAADVAFTPRIPFAGDSLPSAAYVPLWGTLQYNSSKIDTVGLRKKLDNYYLPFICFAVSDHLDYVKADAVEITEKDNLTQVVFPVYGINRHPTQLYEALWYGVWFLFCWLGIYGRPLRDGQLFGMVMIGIWGGRFVLEYFKEPQAGFEPWLLHMGQWLSIPFLIIGIFFWFRHGQEGSDRVVNT